MMSVRLEESTVSTAGTGAGGAANVNAEGAAGGDVL